MNAQLLSAEEGEPHHGNSRQIALSDGDFALKNRPVPCVDIETVDEALGGMWDRILV